MAFESRSWNTLLIYYDGHITSSPDEVRASESDKARLHRFVVATNVLQLLIRAGEMPEAFIPESQRLLDSYPTHTGRDNVSVSDVTVVDAHVMSLLESVTAPSAAEALREDAA